jgi:hypothetical protein
MPSSPKRRGRHKGPRKRSLALTFAVLLLLSGSATAGTTGLGNADPADLTGRRSGRPGAPGGLPGRILEVQSLDGRGNNQRHPEWGATGTQYARVARPNYADGIGEQVAGPSTRYVSNRLFNDIDQNIFSERGVTQWGFTWGQFIDHTIGLREESEEKAPIAFDNDDPLESFTNTLGGVPFTRSAAAPGTGVTTPRQQINTVNSYVDAEAVYGATGERLEWMREGRVDGDLGNNGAHLFLPENYLPRRDSRDDAQTAPEMGLDGRLLGQPDRATVAGDKRANENIALTATHTLFAREHNRIVDLLPDSLTEEQKFQIARRVVIAEQQYITYTEFLPAMGVRLPRYRGYDPRVNASLSNEFATVGYRAHSQIHGEIEIETDAERYSGDTIEALEKQGVEIATSEDGEEVELAVPLNVAFFNPDLVNTIELGPLLQGIGLEAEYQNDEQIDNQLRSVLFQIPVSGNPGCLDGPTLPECFQGVVDLGALDIERGRDHGMPSYNDLRRAYGLAPKRSFTAITGEATESFPSDPELEAGTEIDDASSLDHLRLMDVNGETIPADSDDAEAAVIHTQRRTTLAARLKAMYSSVDKLDAFAGMVAEQHRGASDLGELQRAIWERQFRELRDGDRFFYGNDPGLRLIRSRYGIDYRRTLGDLIALNTDIPREELAPNVFFVHGDEPLSDCRVSYRAVNQANGDFRATIAITNTSDYTVDRWTLRFSYGNGQVITTADGAEVVQGRMVELSNGEHNGRLRPGRTVRVGLAATAEGSNPPPKRFSLNMTRCSQR